ncbi:MAG: menaquinone biosynthesis protein, partial [Mucinivorans sp.]
MSRVRVVAVSYLNTVPMIYGITHAATNELRDGLVLCPPAACADALIDGSADVALVPVATLKNLPQARLITPYCISASGPVATVVLLTNTPTEQITTIYLDSQSRTSVQLVRILARQKWQIDVRYIDHLPQSLAPGQAMVAIGDKVFDLQEHYLYKIDLAQEWQQMTNLPFVFAVWATCRNIDSQTVDALTQAIGYGIRHIPMAVPWDKNRERNIAYLTSNIEFELNRAKHEAINL